MKADYIPKWGHSFPEMLLPLQVNNGFSCG